MLILSLQEKAEFGLMNSEFGDAVLFHAGFQRIGDFSKRLCNCFIGHFRSNLFRQLGYLHGCTFARRVDFGIFAKRRDDG